MTQISMNNNDRARRPFRTNHTEASFYKLFVQAVKDVQQNENRYFSFQFNESTRVFMREMFYYFNYMEKYSGNLDKGLFLNGPVGAGKTFLMKVLVRMIEQSCGKVFTIVHSRKVLDEIEAKGIDYFIKRPLYIDDLGKENLEAKLYGTPVRPIEDLIAYRDREYSILFATSNYHLETFKEHYSLHIYDRLRSMLNVHTINGKSLRN